METNTKKRGWQQARKDFLQYLENMQLSKRKLSDYVWILNKLEKYMQSNNKRNYSEKIGKAFTQDMRSTLGRDSLTVIVTTIRRLDDFLSTGDCAIHASKPKPKLPKPFQEHLDGYIEFSRLGGLRESTIARNTDYCRKALFFFWEQGIRRLSDICPKDVHAAFIASKEKTNLPVSLRSFFRYLYKIGIHNVDLSLNVPSVRNPQVLPSTYTKDEIAKLLSSVDKTSEMGKRDYLIILLAQKLGIRSGDIAKLKRSDINFHLKTIEFIQEKTLSPHKLELLPDIENALLEYFEAKRSVDDFGYVFIRTIPPYTKITRAVVSNVVRKAFKAANICTDGKKYGPHSLRMTLASELVSENTPYMAVGRILGHEDPNAAKHYVKFDIEMLRDCALDVPELSGTAAKKLRAPEGGR